MIAKLTTTAKQMKRDGIALYFAAKDPRTPWYAKALAVGVVAYLVSPIDLIPDFIPFFGMLDDLIIVPAGVALVVRLTPAIVMEESRVKAIQVVKVGTRAAWVASFVVLAIWAYIIWSVVHLFR